MGQAGRKKALFINYLPPCNKEYHGFETLAKAVIFFSPEFSECFSDLNFLLFTDERKVRQGGNKERKGELKTTSKRD